MSKAVPANSYWQQYIPQLITVLKRGYSMKDFSTDVVSGLTVAIVALPLSMALAIASGTTPDKGLVTAIVAGFLISALGGSRVQIGGPAGAFVVVVFNIIAQHGYDGLVMATMMASVMLVIAGLSGAGAIIKFMPQPVITGFTTGIAIIIFSSQIKDFFGLQMDKVPAEFLDKWSAYASHITTIDPLTLGLAGTALALIILLRKYAPKVPSFLFAVVGGALAVWAFNLPTETIGTKFGGIPNSLPMPSLGSFDLSRLGELLPSALTIAFLAGIESLLSAVVADGMTGERHRSNMELVAQGLANGASSLFGGLPATGTIARTVTNIRSGAKSPISGMLHCVFLLGFIYFMAPLASYVPLACLAAVLMMVAWNMAELKHFGHIATRAPRGDRVVLILTFGLTALVDLTVAIEAGMVLTAFIFMYRMTKVTEVKSHAHGHGHGDNPADDSAIAQAFAAQRAQLPSDVELFKLRGPFFFGVTTRLADVLARTSNKPKTYLLDMEDVPMMDSSGAAALQSFITQCASEKVTVILSGLQQQPYKVLNKMHILSHAPNLQEVKNFQQALKIVQTA